jgi:undecaprenyl diphosphate synthase
MQSTPDGNSDLHVAVIMDGNGRWASAQGLPRSAGHRAGVESLRRVCEGAPALGVATLTVFAFSSDNWRRPADEVGALMGMLARYLDTETENCIRKGVRLEAIGRRDRLGAALSEAIARAETATAGGERLRLRVAIDYSARDAILAAARGL